MFLERRVLNRIKHSIENKENFTREDIESIQKLIKRSLCKAYVALKINQKITGKNLISKFKRAKKDIFFWLNALNDLKDYIYTDSKERQFYLLSREFGLECWILEDHFKNANVKTFQQYLRFIIALVLEFLGRIKGVLNDKAFLFSYFYFPLFENKIFEAVKRI